MRDLLFKNITSENKRQRILYSSELLEQNGLRTTVHRHLVCRVLDMANPNEALDILPPPDLYIVKKRNTKSRIESFYCRIKGGMYFSVKNKIYMASFIHSLRIQLKTVNI